MRNDSKHFGLNELYEMAKYFPSSSPKLAHTHTLLFAIYSMNCRTAAQPEQQHQNAI